MQSIVIYLSKAVLCSGLMLGYYWIALRNKRFHSYNRFYLLTAMAASLLVPFLYFPWLDLETASPRAIALMQLLYTERRLPDVVVNNNGQGFSWQVVLQAAAVMVSLFCVVKLLFQISKILLLRKHYDVTRLKDFYFVNTDLAQAPFSFLNYLFWRKDIDINTNYGHQIFEHELAHISQKHTWDKLFMQLLSAVFWINPFYWIAKKELYMIHEFIADEKAVKNEDVSAFAAMLLGAHYGNAFAYEPAHPFFYSSVKRRLLMFTKSKKTRFSYARRVMLLPLLCAILFLFAFRVHKKQQDEQIKKLETLVAIKNQLQPDIPMDTPIIVPVKTTKQQIIIDDSIELKNKKTMLNGQQVKSIGIDKVTIIDTVKITLADGSVQKITSNEAIDKGIIAVDASGSSTAKLIKIRKQNANSDTLFLSRNTINKEPDASPRPFAAGSPLIFVNGVEQDRDMLSEMNKDDIESISVLKDETAKAIYGLKGKNGVILVTTKTVIKPSVRLTEIGEPIYILDGTPIDKFTFSEINQNDIASISILKNESVKAIYGLQAKNGVILITTKTAQKDSAKTDTRYEKEFTQVQAEATYPGGNEAWARYLRRNLQTDVPVKNGAKAGRYTVVVSFLVDENGNISSVRAETDPGYGTAAEAMRAIKSSGKWEPALQNGHPVKYRQKQAITFMVQK
ncbi:MAG: energy transducer TonB [Chitinophagaceae bacterium]|jgi:TonB-dependent SusC/RagA subfamily outer membrane receptor|nr:energy transducer TonB [Chitinophagaceae bacterium]